MRRLGAAALLWACAARLAALSSGADFLSVDVPARPASLGGAYVAFHDDPYAFQWNPAALGALDQPLLGATHFSSIVDTAFDEASFAQPLNVWGSRAGLGLALQYDSTANFDQVDAAGNDVGSVANYDLLMDVAGGLALDSTLRLGVAAKVFSSRLADYHARGLAVDVGGQADVHPRVTLAASLDNLGVQEAYDQQSDPLPTLLRLGAWVQAMENRESRIVGSLELDRPFSSNAPITLGLGAEYWYLQTIVFRAGYQFGVEQGPISLGVGFKWKGMTVDYAYSSLGDLGLLNRFSLGLELGTLFQRLGLTVDPIQGERSQPKTGPGHYTAPWESR